MLKPDAVAALFAEYRAGSFGARQRLIRGHRRLAYHIPFWTPYFHDMQEMRSDAAVGLVQAVDSFPGPPRPFVPYARVVIRNNIIAGLRRRHVPGLVLSMDRGSEDNGWSLHDVLPSKDPTPEDALDSIQRADWLTRAVEELSDAERDVLWSRYGRDQTMRATARDLGMGETTVRNISKRAINALRERMGSEAEGMPTPRRRRRTEAAEGVAGRGGGIVDIDDVREIHRQLKAGTSTQREIAKRFGLSEQQVSLIKTGKRWRHVYEEQVCA